MLKGDFKARVEARSEATGSRLVLALDPEAKSPKKALARGLRILSDVSDLICAVKVNQPLVLSLGLQGASRITRRASALDIPCIMDSKLSDVGHINEAVARQLFKAGFDAIIASPLVGWRGGLEPLVKLAHRDGRGIITLAYMSHEGADEFFKLRVADRGLSRRLYELFALKALRWGLDGIVVGATRPRVIRQLKNLTKGDVPIYSPGIGPQGGQVRRALRAGANYVIVGRSIVLSRDPRGAAKALLEQSAS